MAKDRTAFGKYRVIARLGRGGMGHVYLAVSVGPAGVQKLVVLKHLREDLALSVGSRSMFMDEARISTRLNHPNIVQTNEVVDEGDDLYLVMDFLDGQPLSRILDPAHSSQFPLATKLKILVGVLEGLHYAHELTDYDGQPLKVVHRDVSPQNVIVTYDGHVKLLDFGVAKAAGATTVTESGVFKGKVRYSSPEQAMCLHVDRRADIFAVGTILWEVIANRRMWSCEADAAVLIGLGSGQLPSLRAACPDVPRELEAICAKALSTEPEDRFPTAAAFESALLEYLRTVNGETSLAARMASTFGKERRELQAAIDMQTKVLRESSSDRLTMREIPVLAPESASSLGMEKSIGRHEGTGGTASMQAALVRTRTPWIAIAGIAAVFVLAVGVTRFGRSEDRAPPAASGGSQETPPSVHFKVQAMPPSARVSLDGKALPSNPYQADVTRDDAAHRLTVSAEGYESQETEAHFARNVDLVITLAPKARAAAPSVTSAGASGPRPAPARGAAPSKRAQDRSIDEEDPYK
jgi:serine/threonine protein kinase